MVEQAEAPPARRRWRAAGWAVLLALLPWTWFLVRDLLGAVTDVLAILLPILVLLVVVAALAAARRRPLALVLAMSTLLMGSAAVVGPWLPADAGPVAVGLGVTVAGANSDGGRRPADSAQALAADVLVVAELFDRVAGQLSEAYPHSYVRIDTNPRIGVFSRFPLRLLEAAGPDLPGERLEVDAPGGPFVLYALHVPRPWFQSSGSGSAIGDAYQATVTEHQRLVEQVAVRVRAETLPVVVIGDLNSTDRGRDYRTLTGAGGLVDAMLDSVAGPTSVGKWEPLLARIDHILVSPGWCGDAPRRADLPGSSHLAVTATVGPCGSS